MLVGSLALLAGVTLKREAAIHSLNRWLFNRIYALTKQSLKTPVKHIRHKSNTKHKSQSSKTPVKHKRNKSNT